MAFDPTTLIPLAQASTWLAIPAALAATLLAFRAVRRLLAGPLRTTFTMLALAMLFVLGGVLAATGDHIYRIPGAYDTYNILFFLAVLSLAAYNWSYMNFAKGLVGLKGSARPAAKSRRKR